MGMGTKSWRVVLVSATLAVVAMPVEAASKKSKDNVMLEEGRTQTMTFSRPFVVPVGDDLRTTGMVVVSLNIEMTKKDALLAQEKEEILRDRILSALMGLSYAGEFDKGITDPKIGEKIKEVVREAVDKVFPGVTQEVLIQDLLSRRVV